MTEPKVTIKTSKGEAEMGTPEAEKLMEGMVKDALASPVVMLNVFNLQAAALAASKDKTRAYLCTVLVEVDCAGNCVTGTDGHQLVSIKDDTYPSDDVEDPFTMMIPAEVVKELGSLLLKKSKEAGLFSSHVKAQKIGKELVFTSLAGGDHTRLGQITCTEMNAEYPDYRRVIPDFERLTKGTPAQLVSFNWHLCANVQKAAGLYRYGGANKLGT